MSIFFAASIFHFVTLQIIWAALRKRDNLHTHKFSLFASVHVKTKARKNSDTAFTIVIPPIQIKRCGFNCIAVTSLFFLLYNVLFKNRTICYYSVKSKTLQINVYESSVNNKFHNSSSYSRSLLYSVTTETSCKE